MKSSLTITISPRKDSPFYFRFLPDVSLLAINRACTTSLIGLTSSNIAITEAISTPRLKNTLKIVVPSESLVLSDAKNSNIRAIPAKKIKYPRSNEKIAPA